MSRTEPVSIKVYGTIKPVESTWLLATSNQNLFRHVFENGPPGPFGNRRRVYRSDVTDAEHHQDVLAMMNRFIEVLVIAPPILPQSALPSCGKFNRRLFINQLLKQL